MLADVPDHAAALRYTHSFSGNHLITEMTGLASIALAFPEFKNGPQWLDYAVAAGSRRGRARNLPRWRGIGIVQFISSASSCWNCSGWPTCWPPPVAKRNAPICARILENAWNYFAHTLDPAGHGPLNNDSSVGDDAALVRQMAAVYHRPDWLYIATNGREGSPSRRADRRIIFPTPALAVMRSGWGANAQWAFFAMGPRGSDHQHADRLHLSIGGGGREFLVDDGRYNYQPGPWRDYFTGPRGHNVVLLDGQGTLPPPDTVRRQPNVIHNIAPKPSDGKTPDDRFFSGQGAFCRQFLARAGSGLSSALGELPARPILARDRSSALRRAASDWRPSGIFTPIAR